MNKKAVNFAPLKPFTDLKDQTIPEKTVTDHYLVKELRKKYEELVAKDKSSWRNMICAGQVIGLFIEGEQILRINTFNGQPKIEQANVKDPNHIKAINKMRFYATNWLDKWRSSKPDVLLSPLSNTDQAIAQVKKANAVIDYIESQFFQTWFDLQEGMNAQIWGWYGREVSLDYDSKKYGVIKEILGEKEFKLGKDSGRCDCGYRGDQSKEKKYGGKTFYACPECGSLEYDFVAAEKRILPYKKGSEKVFLPEVVCKPLLFPAVRFDLSCRAEESDWFISEKRIEKHKLRKLLGNIRFPEGESGNDFGLDVIDDLASRTSGLSGRGERAKTDPITMTEMYLTADELYDIKIGNEEKTVEGTVLPKGKRMSEVFPNGACITGINGLALITGIYHGCHKDKITSGVYHMKPNSGTGQGVSDAVEIQKQFNRRYSQIDKFMAARATPPILTPEGGIEDRYKRLLSTPDAVIPVKLQNFPEIKSISQLIAPMQGESVPGDLIHVTFDRLEQMLQTAYHITNFGGASPQGVKNDTATYAQINDSNSDAIFSPVLTLKADVTVKTIKNGFYKFCEFTPESRFIPFKSASKSGSFGIEIKGEDVKAEYNWSYVPGSEAPKSRFTETQKRVMFFGQFGGVMGWLEARKMFPNEVAEIERDFDVNFETDSQDSLGELCRLRFDRAKAKLGKQDNLTILANLEPSLLITEPALPSQITWFQNLLISPEGMQMKSEERELVSTFVLVLRELAKGVAIEEQTTATEIQMAAQAPMMEQQAAQQQQEAAMAQQQQQEQMLGQAAGMVAEGINSEQQMAAQQELADNEDAMEAASMLHEANQNAEQRAADIEIAKQQKK